MQTKDQDFEQLEEYSIDSAQALVDRQYPAATETARRRMAEMLRDYVQQTGDAPERALIKLF